jgi:limonene 1,2-monooxygenase
MGHRMRFGIFLAPFHKPGINPTMALEQDLELVTWLDRCGYDEAWCGEHHSAGSEISASPEIFIAVASQRSRTIKLGTGVVSMSYHNPLWVAERIVQLDHLTRGRVMLGMGPGSLPSDGIMIGVSQNDTRRLLGPARRAPAPAALQQPAVRHRRSRGGFAHGPQAGRYARRGLAFHRCHHGGGL